MFVEDKTSYNGPISIRVSPKLTVEELKDYVHCEFEIPIGVQKWILGKSLVEDEKSTLLSHGISKNGQKVFLYLVAPGILNRHTLFNYPVKLDHKIIFQQVFVSCMILLIP